MMMQTMKQEPSTKVPVTDNFKNEKVRMLSGWNLLKLSHQRYYWSITDQERTNLSTITPDKNQLHRNYAIYEVRIYFKRSFPYFGFTILFPCAVATLLTLVSFVTKERTMTTFLLFGSLIIQILFLFNLVHSIPASTGKAPKIVVFYVINLITTTFAVFVLVVLYDLLVGTEPNKKIRVLSLLELVVNNRFFRRVDPNMLSFENRIYNPTGSAQERLSSNELDDNEAWLRSRAMQEQQHGPLGDSAIVGDSEIEQNEAWLRTRNSAGEDKDKESVDEKKEEVEKEGEQEPPEPKTLFKLSIRSSGEIFDMIRRNTFLVYAVTYALVLVILPFV